jgi:hypothetical protein
VARLPIRGIKEASVSHGEKPTARRAIVEAVPPAPTPPRTETGLEHLALPRFGAAERQLVFAYLATGVVVLFLIVALPAFLEMVRNF